MAATSAITRWGLRAFVDHDSDLRLVQECATLEEVAKATVLAEEDPAILLIGSSLASASNLLQQLSARCSVVVFVETDDVAVADLLRVGVRGMVDHRDDIVAVSITLTAVRNGVTALDPRSLRRLLDRQSGGPVETDEVLPDCLARLGGRERDVLACLAEGWTNRQISSHLHLTEGTVKGYVSAVLNKLGLPNRTAAALQARTWGLQPLSAT